MKPVVLICTKNEEETIAAIISQIPYDVFIVDDSNDNTPNIALEFPNVSLVKGEDKGIADAYVSGLQYLRHKKYTHIVQMDAGGTHNPCDIPRLLEIRADLVIGSRMFEWRGVRTAISLTAAYLFNALVFTEKGYLGTKTFLEDVTSGFRAWDAELLNDMDLDLNSKGFAFQLELLCQAYKKNASVASVPIEYKLTNSTLKPWMLMEALWILAGCIFRV